MKRTHDQVNQSDGKHGLSIFPKEKVAKLDDDHLVQLISHLKHEYSSRILEKLNNLPDEMMALILSFLDRFEIISLGSLLFFKKWSRFIFHHDEYWSGFWREIFPNHRVEYDFTLHNEYLLGRIRDFERFRNLHPVMAEIVTGGGSELSVTHFFHDKNFTSNIYYVEWPIQTPLAVNAYEGYNAQECERFTSIPEKVIGVYYSNVNPTKFYFSMESEFESRRGESEYVDSTLIYIDWITSQKEKIERILDGWRFNFQAVQKLLKTALLQDDIEYKEWSMSFLALLKENQWLSRFFFESLEKIEDENLSENDAPVKSPITKEKKVVSSDSSSDSSDDSSSSSEEERAPAPTLSSLLSAAKKKYSSSSESSDSEDEVVPLRPSDATKKKK